MITRLPLHQFRRRPEWPVVRGWLKAQFPRQGWYFHRLGGDLFFECPRVHEAWVCSLVDGEAVLVYLWTRGSATWVLVLGEIVLPLEARFPSRWMTGPSLAAAVLVEDLGPELARRVAYGEVTRAELEAELILRSLGGLVPS